MSFTLSSLEPAVQSHLSLWVPFPSTSALPFWTSGFEMIRKWTHMFLFCMPYNLSLSQSLRNPGISTFLFLRYTKEILWGLICLCKHLQRCQNVQFKKMFCERICFLITKWFPALEKLTVLYLLSWFWRSHGDYYSSQSLTSLFQVQASICWF